MLRTEEVMVTMVTVTRKISSQNAEVMPASAGPYSDSDGDTIDHWSEALVQAVIQDPRNIEQFAGQPIAYSVFEQVLEEQPDNLRLLFSVARSARHPACLTQLVDHAIATGRTDALVYLFMRLRSPWHDESAVANQLIRLLRLAKPWVAQHLLCAASPNGKLWFTESLDVDAVWRCAIRGHIARGDYRSAYDCLILAGRGLMAHRQDQTYCQLPQQKREYLTDVKDFRKNDDLFWPTYVRARRFGRLVRDVWEAHKQAGLISDIPPDGYSGKDAVEINVIARNNAGHAYLPSRRRVPHRGLIARFSDLKTVKKEYLFGFPFVWRPKIQGAVLRAEGAMLQQLILYWLPRVVGKDWVNEPDRNKARGKYLIVDRDSIKR